jgi:hypothetical protein
MQARVLRKTKKQRDFVSCQNQPISAVVEKRPGGDDVP